MNNHRSICIRNRRDWLGRKLCACGCPRLVPKRRVNWATDECYARANPTHMRFLVYQRDKGICALCGVDCERMKRRAGRSRWHYSSAPEANSMKFWSVHEFLREKFTRSQQIYRKWERKIEKAAENRRARMAEQGWPLDRATFWDADHIVPVVDGGGLCGLENYRTLCVPCHKAETKKLAARRAAERRAKK